jgi:hypothetical protein
VEITHRRSECLHDLLLLEVPPELRDALLLEPPLDRHDQFLLEYPCPILPELPKLLPV